MKTKNIPEIIRPGLFLTGCMVAVALLAGATRCTAATPLDDTVTFTNSFDTSASVTSWIYWYGNGSNNNAMAWDSAMDAANDPNSGSLLFETTFPASEQLAWFGTFGNRWAYDTEYRHDATKYTNIIFDIHVDPTSAATATGTYGVLQIGFYDGPNVIGNQTIPSSATNGWVRMTQPINPSTPGISSVSGIAFKIQTYNTNDNPVGHVKFWIDNLKMIVSPVPIPPPRMATPFIKPIQGLNLLSSAGNGDQYQRTSILYNEHTGVGWVGASSPVTYSLTITNFPDGAYTNYQAHIFITTGNTPPSYETAPDYNETNVIFFDVHQNPDGTASAYFRYKVNEYQANSNMFGVEYVGPASAGTLGGITNSSILGTWGFTFNQDTNVTIFGPGGVITNITMRPEAVANFAEPLNVLFGAQPNQQSLANPLANIGQRVVLSSLGITNGTSTIVSDNFMADTALDTNLFTRLAGDVNMVQLVPAGSAFWIKWSLPDVDFGLQTSTNFANSNSWVNLTGPAAGGATLPNYTVTGFRYTLIPSSVLGSGANYFRLVKTNAAVSSAVLLDSFETAVYTGAANPPYTNVSQSSTAGVTQGTYSMKVNYDASGTWTWFGHDYPASSYDDWHNHSKLLFDLHREAETFGWNLDFAFAINGAMGWNQNEPVNWVWLNSGESSSQTITWDYSSIKSSAPSSGTYFQLNFMARGNSGGGGNVYIDNVRFSD